MKICLHHWSPHEARHELYSSEGRSVTNEEGMLSPWAHAVHFRVSSAMNLSSLEESDTIELH